MVNISKVSSLSRRRLIPGLNPAPPVLGGAEVAAQSCELDSLCPSMPLDVFRVYDAAAVSEVWLEVASHIVAGCPRSTAIARNIPLDIFLDIFLHLGLPSCAQTQLFDLSCAVIQRCPVVPA
jgi:hypothetical protein